MQLIFVVILFIIGAGGSIAGFRHLDRKKLTGGKRRLIYFGSIVFLIVAVLALVYLAAALLLINGIK